MLASALSRLYFSSMLQIVVIIIRAADGRYFIHQRAEDKRLFPGLYGIGAGGKVAQGEAPSEAAARELCEETELAGPLRPLFSFEYVGEAAQHHLHIFELQAEGEPRVAHGEWKWCGWVSEEELDRLADEGKLCPDTLQLYRRYRG